MSYNISPLQLTPPAPCHDVNDVCVVVDVVAWKMGSAVASRRSSAKPLQLVIEILTSGWTDDRNAVYHLSIVCLYFIYIACIINNIDYVILYTYAVYILCVLFWGPPILGWNSAVMPAPQCLHGPKSVCSIGLKCPKFWQSPHPFWGVIFGSTAKAAAVMTPIQVVGSARSTLHTSCLRNTPGEIPRGPKTDRPREVGSCWSCAKTVKFIDILKFIVNVHSSHCTILL